MPYILRLFAAVFLLVPVLHGAEWWVDIGARELVPGSIRPPQSSTAVALLAPINGVASAQIAVRADAPLTAFTATVSPLTGPIGTLPPQYVQIRYLTNTARLPGSATPAADAPLTAMSEHFIPTTSALGVVYLTANIPPGTTAGTYTGTVTVQSASSVAVPITVTVADFVMPGRSDIDPWIALMQSPAQLAFAYKVPPYSDEHWQRIAASTRLLGDLGHHITAVPVLWHANVGSGPQLVSFTRDGSSLKPDFSQLERYFRLVATECGPQRLLVLGVWGRWLPITTGTTSEAAAAAKYASDTLHLTERMADGSFKPLAWSSDYAAHEALWKSVYDGVAALAKTHLGVAADRIVLGFGDDYHPSAAIDEVWQRIAPLSPGWDAWTHNYGGKGPRPAFFQVVDTAAPTDVADLLAWPAATRAHLNSKGAQEPFYISSCRDIQHSGSPAALYYSIPDLAVGPQKTGHCIGFARIGLDYWDKDIPLVDGSTIRGDGYARDGSKGRNADNRAYPGRVVRNYRGVLSAPGPDGAWPLIHFDALREGVQAAQARITVVKAIKAFPDQAAALTAVLAEQFTSGARHGLLRTASRSELAGVTSAVLQHGWAPLFTAAGSAQRQLGSRAAAEASASAELKRRQP